MISSAFSVCRESESRQPGSQWAPFQLGMTTAGALNGADRTRLRDAARRHQALRLAALDAQRGALEALQSGLLDDLSAAPDLEQAGVVERGLRAGVEAQPGVPVEAL